jgi:excisionase family DNA binding protein
MEAKTLVDEAEIARLLNVPPVYVGKLRRRGLIPFIRLGHRTIRFETGKVLTAVERLRIREVA